MAEPNPRATADATFPVDGANGAVELDDVALGFECADPRLQIESWRADDGRTQGGHVDFG